jgi:Flp pilus assembly protein CpaB
MTVDHRFRNIVIAAVLAAAAALLTVVYVSTARDESAAQGETVTVYVPTRTFPIGTPGSKIAGSLEKQTVTRSSLTPKAVTSPDEIKDLYTTETVYSGEQLSLNRFVPPKQVGVLSLLKGKERAIQVAGDETQMLDGTLQPGDRVDVVANLRNPGNQNDVRSLVILRDLRVLQTQDGEGATINDPEDDRSLAILAMTSEQAQRFAYARFNSNDQWWLQLRPVKQPKDGETKPATFQTVVRGG